MHIHLSFFRSALIGVLIGSLLIAALGITGCSKPKDELAEQIKMDRAAAGITATPQGAPLGGGAPPKPGASDYAPAPGSAPPPGSAGGK